MSKCLRLSYVHLRRYHKYIAMPAASAATIPAANIATAALNPLGSPFPVADGAGGATKSCTAAGMVGGGSGEGMTDDDGPLWLGEVVSWAVSGGLSVSATVARGVSVRIGGGADASVGEGRGVGEGVAVIVGDGLGV